MRGKRALVSGIAVTCMIGTSTPALAGPPVQRPASASQPAASEPAPVEPAPLEPAPVEPAPLEPAPAEQTTEPPPSEPLVEEPAEPSEPPPSEAALPSFDSAPPSPSGSGLQSWSEVPEVPRLGREVPPDGKGALTFGSMMMIGGVVATGLGIAAFPDEGADWGITGVVAGVASFATGIGIVGMGAKRNRRYRDWLPSSGMRPPAQGNGLLAAGSATLIGSTVVFTTSALAWSRFWWDVPEWALSGFGIAGAGLAVGSALLITGAARNGQFKRWQKQDPYVLPTVALSRQGMQIGLSGRF